MPQVSSKIIPQRGSADGFGVTRTGAPLEHQTKNRCNHPTCWEQVSLPRLESQGSVLDRKGLVRTCMCPLEDLLPSANVTGPASDFSFFIY